MSHNWPYRGLLAAVIWLLPSLVFAQASVPIGPIGGGGSGSSGFPITIGSTSIAAGSTTTTIAGLTLTAPTLTTPTLGVATGTSLALGGAAIGGNALAVTGIIAGSSNFLSQNGGFGSVTTFGGSTYNLSLGVFGASGDLIMANASNISWASGSTHTGSNSEDAILRRRAPASIQLGAADAATAVAQTIGVQGVAAGNLNVAGANFTIAGSQGTGTGAGGSLIFQVAAAGSTGTAQNALATALTIDSTKLATFAGAVKFAASTTGAGTQTFTNSPCSTLSSEQWITVQITGQTGTWNIPACQ